MLTQRKEFIAAAAGAAARQAMQNHTAMGAYGYSMNQNSVMGMLTDLIAKAVEAGIAEALNSMYTNEEFEQDIGLKS